MATIKSTLVSLGVSAIALALLSGCGSDSGSEVQENVDPNRDLEPVSYSGPPPQTDDVQQFKISVWDPLAVENRCGSCHGGDQAPNFVRDDDINLAYSAANEVVDLTNPANSRLVTKVAEGHNCWQASTDACADIITGYVEAWASASGSIVSQVNFEAPEDREVGTSKIMPSEPGNFADTVYPLLTEYCSECHSRSAPTAQQPYIGSSSLELSYDASKTRMRLDNPTASRLVRRLGDEGHNCWDDDCQASASAMENAISAFADSIPVTEVDPDLVVSRALALGDGIVASTGGRVDTHIIAKYEFKTGDGAVAYDTSGVEPSANLNLSGDVEWMSSWGIRLNSSGGADGKAQAATSGSRKLHQLLTATGEYTIEAWVIPDNVSQGDGGGDTARIVSYSGSADVRNFTLGQTLYNYDFLNRSSETDVNGLPALATADADERLQATLQHVVATFDPVNGRRLYVNGEFTGDEDPLAGAALEEWNETFALVLGNEVSGTNYAWSGSLRFLALHNRSLSPEAIQSNFDVGVGARFYLLFNVSHLLDVPSGYVAFEVQQFDDYGYLFAEPFFITLDDDAEVPTVPLEGIRIGVNGKEASTGQVFAALETEISADQFEEGRQLLSGQGAVIELQQGPDSDQFFLTFDRLGSHEFVRVEADPPSPVEPQDIPDQPGVGLRSFAAINATLSSVTQVPRTTEAVANTYQKVRQQLPTQPGAEGFLAAHQMGVTQLAVSYCNALASDSGLRGNYFPGFNFGAGVDTAFNTQGRTAVIEPLLQNVLAAEIEGEALASQAAPDDLRDELNGLIDIMTAAGGNSERTQKTVTAVCAATLASALTLLQ